jgi:LysR family transcriptional regulator (chromosome initiation inhibitor)
VSGLRAGVWYVPVASAAFVERYLPDGFTADAVAAAPSLAWNRDDALQDQLVRTVFRKNIVRSTHYVPTAEGFGAAVREGLGWGMFPDRLVDPALTQVTDHHLDVPLFWQCWNSTARLWPWSPTQSHPPPQGFIDGGDRSDDSVRG